MLIYLLLFNKRLELWNMDHASFFSEAILIEIGVYIRDKVHKKPEECFESKTSTWQNKQGSQHSL